MKRKTAACVSSSEVGKVFFLHAILKILSNASGWLNTENPHQMTRQLINLMMMEWTTNE